MITNEIDGAKVLYYSAIDNIHKPTGACKHTVYGKSMESASGLAICQYDEDESFYLFYCNSKWEVITDTLHQTIEGAMKQAEFEYQGINKTWIKKT